jgi:putative PEP-CTERM system histidine kinase
LLLLFTLFFSGGLRARLKVFFSKHFFKNKYDYRKEWLRFTATLSAGDNVSQVPQVQENVVRAMCTIVESPGGVLWMHRGQQLEVVATWNTSYPSLTNLSKNCSLVSFVTRTRWVVFLDECRAGSGNYEGLVLPESFSEDSKAWVVVPLTLAESLLGFVVLQRSNSNRSMNWEDSDLLKAVGQQAVSYLALYDTAQALAQAQQFDAFNRLSSYVVHDLKNVIAQLALVGENAKKHIDNPEFVKDAFRTVDNATTKMSRMLSQLRKDSMEETSSKLVNIDVLLQKVVGRRSAERPVPSLESLGDGLIVRADADRLSSVFEHLIQNAQEATSDDGVVAVRASRSRRNDTVMIEIEDSGCGMDENFIRQRLYKPFDTTKGNAGMGIGVYEARDFVVSSGGDLSVKSHPGKGTVFTVKLPSHFDGVHRQDASSVTGATP